MAKIDWSVISTIASTATALVAIVAPVVTSFLANKSQERMKKMEVYIPRVYDALAEMTEAYGNLTRIDTSHDEESYNKLYLLAVERCQEFEAACYKVMSLVPGENIQRHIAALLQDIGHSALMPSSEHDKIFCQLISEVHQYLLTSKVKNKKQHTQD